MAADVHGRSQRIGILQQSKASNHWSAPQAASANFQTIPYDAFVSIPDPNVNVDYFNFTSSGLMPESSRLFVDGVSGLPTINFSGVSTYSNGLLAQHLIAALQDVVEVVTTPYVKTITPANTVLDFANNGGYLFSIALDGGGSQTDGVILENALLDELVISINPNATGVAKLMQWSGKWVGNELEMSQDLTGTWVAMPTGGQLNTNTLGFTCALTVGSTVLSDVCWRNFTMRYNNNVFSDCKTTGGKANNFKIAPRWTWTLDIVYNSATYAIFKSYKDGDSVSLDLYNGDATPDATGEITFDFPNAVLTANPFVYEGEYMALRIEAENLYLSGSENNIVLADGVDGNYPAS